MYLSKEACEKFRSVYLQTRTDPEYLALEAQRREWEPAFLSALDALETGQREAILNYLGILQEQELRTLELACFTR